MFTSNINHKFFFWAFKTCNKIIDPSEQYMTYDKKAYHKQCFTCFACHESLAGKQFCIKDNQYYCPEHV